MKLRFRQNSLRLRLNRGEAEGFSQGTPIEEQVHFPGDTRLAYVLESGASAAPDVKFNGCMLRVSIPRSAVDNWVKTDAIGMYFELPANGTTLKIAIEKDLECIDGPASERDPDAFPRSGKNC